MEDEGRRKIETNEIEEGKKKEEKVEKRSDAVLSLANKMRGLILLHALYRKCNATKKKTMTREEEQEEEEEEKERAQSLARGVYQEVANHRCLPLPHEQEV